MSFGHHWHDLFSVLCLFAAMYFKAAGVDSPELVMLAVYFQVRAVRAESRTRKGD